MAENMLLQYLLRMRGGYPTPSRRQVGAPQEEMEYGMPDSQFFIEAPGGQGMIPNPDILSLGEDSGMAEDAARTALRRRMEQERILRLLEGA